jgi:hypothetical protein
MNTLSSSLLACTIAACIGWPAHAVDGTFTVTEEWSVTLEYDQFGNHGFTGTRQFSGRETGTLIITGDTYTLINRTGFQIQVDPEIKERSIYCPGASCSINGDFAFAPAFGARAYGVLFLGCFMVKVPLIDGEVPAFYDFEYFSAFGPSLASMEGSGQMVGISLRATVRSSLSLTAKGTPQSAPPRILASPRHVTVDYGRKAVLSVRAAGTAPLSFQWLKDGNPIDGANSGTLTLAQCTSDDAGEYGVLVSNGFGNATSGSATVTVRPPVAPRFTIQPHNKALRADRKLKLTSRAKGSTPLTYQWFFNGEAIAAANSNFFLVTATQPDNAGTYYVVANNPAGSVTSHVAAVTVKLPAP